MHGARGLSSPGDDHHAADYGLAARVGYDGSPPAERALDAAVNRSQGHFSCPAWPRCRRCSDWNSFDEIEQELAPRSTQLPEGWDFQRREGLIAEELLAAVKDIGAAHPQATVVIVVGSSSLVTHRVVGSVAVGLARHSPVPLVVVP